MQYRRHLIPRAAFSAVAMAALSASHRALALSWNATQPTFSAISANGLDDAPTLFIDENVVTNTANSTRGTGTYLGDGWVLTAQHVIQGTGGYGTFAPASSINMNVSIGGVSQTYTADVTTVPSSADIALIHLVGTNAGPIAALAGVLKSAIQTNTNENNTLVQLGGFGYYGPLAGTLSTNAVFHRAFNIATTGGAFMNVPANASTRLVNDGYVMGIGESGDSGSGLWMDTAADSDTNLWDYNLIGALDTTSNTNQFGSNNQYSRVSSNSGWLLSNAYAGHATVFWDANSAAAGIQEGSGTWDLSNPNFGNGVDNVVWDNSTTLNAYFGAHKGAAGTVTLGANVSVQNMMFNPAVSGNYTIAGSGGFTLSISSTSIITSYADATISATISGGGGTLSKLGPAVLTLAGSNTFGGTVSLGDGATSGGNGNGALRIASSSALNNVTLVNILDNNAAHATFQLDGSAGSVTLPASVAFSWNANNDGPAATAANVLENVAGNNTINGAITYHVGGTGYGIASDAGVLNIAGSFTASGTSGKTFFLRGAGDGAFTGILGGSGGAVVVTGSGTWTLNSLNTYTGATTIAGGVLSSSRLTSEGTGGTSSGIGQSSSAASNLILTGGTLRYTGSGASTDRLFTIGPPGGTLDASGSGAVNFFKVGSAVSSDAVSHNAITTSGASTVTITSAGMTDFAIGMPVSGVGIPAGATIAAIDRDHGLITLSAPATANGTPALTLGATDRTLTLTGTSTAANTLVASLANSAAGGKLSLAKAGAGTWFLAGASTYTGSTTVNSGMLNISPTGFIAGSTVSVSSGATLGNAGGISTGSIASAGTFTSTGSLGVIIDFSNSGTATFAGSQNWTPGSTFHNTAGSATFQADAGSAASSNLAVFVTGGSVSFASTQHLAVINITGPGVASVGASAVPLTNPNILNVLALSFASTGTLDLTNNELIATAAASDIRADLIANQIFTTSTGGALGYADLGTGQTEIRFALLGDTNLDGTVNVSDLGDLATNFGLMSGATWVQGDFDYNGTVNVADLGDLATNFGQSLAGGSSFASESAATTLSTAVPEPHSLSVVFSTLLWLRRRRGGKRR